MKEFSQKYSVVLLWSTIVLLIISITLSVCAFCGGRGMMRGNDFNDSPRSKMMQDGGRLRDGSGSRNFNKNLVPNIQGQAQPQAEVPDTTPTVTE